MKRSIGIMCTILCAFLLASCMCVSKVENTENEYSSYIVDMATDGVIAATEKDWWLGRRMQNMDVGETKVVNIGGSEIMVGYEYSNIPKYGRNSVDYYSNDSLTLSFNNSDGSFRGLHHHNLLTKEYFDKDDIENSYETARALAEKTASQYIEVSEYRLFEETMVWPWYTDEDKMELTIYLFHYVKMVGDLKTSDDFYIEITAKGDIRTMNVDDIGLYNELDPEAVDFDKVDESIAKKVEMIYSNKGEYTYSITDQTLAYSPEGELTVVSIIEVNVSFDGEKAYGTLVGLATVVS